MASTDVIGLDLSLTSTGIANRQGTRTLKNRLRGVERLAWIRTAVISAVKRTDVVVIEGYAFGRPQQASHLGELGGVVRLALFDNAIEFVDVPPSSLKKYATGKGNAGKEEMLAEAVRRLHYRGHSHDEADALWLRAMAMDALGSPVVRVPETHRAALAAVSWPSNLEVAS